MKYLKSVITSLFDSQDHKQLAAACSVFIAGVNYRGTAVTFGNMRIWLYEDFLEFFMLSDTPGKTALKERVVERFKVFCKNIFVTTFLNFDLGNNKRKGTILDLVSWLLFVYPSDRPIREGKRISEHSDSNASDD